MSDMRVLFLPIHFSQTTKNTQTVMIFTSAVNPFIYLAEDTSLHTEQFQEDKYYKNSKRLVQLSINRFEFLIHIRKHRIYNLILCTGYNKSAEIKQKIICTNKICKFI